MAPTVLCQNPVLQDSLKKALWASSWCWHPKRSPVVNTAKTCLNDTSCRSGQKRWSHIGLSLAGAATSIIFDATKVLSRQKMSLGINTCLSWQKFVMTNILLSWQMHTFVVTDRWSSRQNTSFVVPKICLLRQTCICCDKHVFNVVNVFVATNICRDKGFVATSIILLRQKFSCNKHTFVTAKNVFCHDNP